MAIYADINPDNLPGAPSNPAAAGTVADPFLFQTIQAWLTWVTGRSPVATDYYGEVTKDAAGGHNYTGQLDVTGISHAVGSSIVLRHGSGMTDIPLISHTGQLFTGDNPYLKVQGRSIDNDANEKLRISCDSLTENSANTYAMVFTDCDITVQNATQAWGDRVDFDRCIVDGNNTAQGPTQDATDAYRYTNTVFRNFGSGKYVWNNATGVHADSLVVGCNFEQVDIVANNLVPEFENNAVSLDGGSRKVFGTESSSISDNCQSNQYHLQNGARMSTSYANLSDYIAGLGSGESNSQQGDPAWTTPGSDYNLTTASPCIEAGYTSTEPEYQYDHNGFERDRWHPDIGAFEAAYNTLPGEPSGVYCADGAIFKTPTEQVYLTWLAPKEEREGGTVQYRLEMSTSASFDEEHALFDSFSGGEGFGPAVVSHEGESYNFSGIVGAVELTLKVNAGGEQTITFVGTETTAQHVVDLINGEGITNLTATVVNIWNATLEVVETKVRLVSDTGDTGSIEVTGGSANTILKFDTLVHYGRTHAVYPAQFEYSTDYTPGADPANPNNPETTGAWSNLGTVRPGSAASGATAYADGTDATVDGQYVRFKTPPLHVNTRWYWRVGAYTGEVWA